MAVIKTAYPNYYHNPQLVNDAITLWSSILKDDRVEDVMEGLYKFIREDNKGFPPVIGQILGHGKVKYKTLASLTSQNFNGRKYDTAELQRKLVAKGRKE